MDWEDLTRRQRGVITREQLADCGVSLPRIDGFIARRELIEALPRVYAPRPVPGSRRQRLWAVALWSSGGVISHHSAAWLWGIPVQSTKIIHVTVADRRYRKPVSGVRLHRVPVGELEVISYDGLPITERERTIVDLLRNEPRCRARDLLDRALQQGWLDERCLTKAIRDSRGRTGNSQLRLLLAAIEPGAHAESERKLHAILRRAGLVGWVAQYRIALPNGVAFADVAFPEQRIAIEVDGRRHHADRFEEDRLRQNEIVLRGWRVLRFTWKMLTERQDLVLSRIVQLLAA